MKKLLKLVFILALLSCSLNLATANAAGSTQKVPTSVLFSVKKYGARGDGITNDTIRIRTAIKAAEVSGGGTVFFEKGLYLVTGIITVPKNVSIAGEGYALTTIKRIDSRNERVLSLMGDQTIQGIGIESNIGVLPIGDNINIIAVKFKCATQGIQNTLTVNNLTVMNSLFEGNGYGILSNNNPSYDVKIINSSFKNSKSDDIEINSASKRWLIENCIFENNISTSPWSGFGVGVAISAKEIVIKNSSFTNIKGQAIHAEDNAEVTVINCNFKNNGSDTYRGSPKADIAVLSNAKVTVIGSLFHESDKGFSNIGIYNTLKPVGGTAFVKSSTFYKKRVANNVLLEDSTLIK